MDAGNVSILAAGEPVAAMVFGIFCFGEIPTAIEFVGLFLTVIAIVLLGMPEKVRSNKTKPKEYDYGRKQKQHSETA